MNMKKNKRIHYSKSNPFSEVNSNEQYDGNYNQLSDSLQGINAQEQIIQQKLVQQSETQEISQHKPQAEKLPQNNSKLAEEKKHKIEMLKLKYLSKNTQISNKQKESNIAEKSISSNVNSKQEQKELTFDKTKKQTDSIKLSYSTTNQHNLSENTTVHQVKTQNEVHNNNLYHRVKGEDKPSNKGQEIEQTIKQVKYQPQANGFPIVLNNQMPTQQPSQPTVQYRPLLPQTQQSYQEKTNKPKLSATSFQMHCQNNLAENSKAQKIVQCKPTKTIVCSAQSFLGSRKNLLDGISSFGIGKLIEMWMSSQPLIMNYLNQYLRECSQLMGLENQEMIFKVKKGKDTSEEDLVIEYCLKNIVPYSPKQQQAVYQFISSKYTQVNPLFYLYLIKCGPEYLKSYTCLNQHWQYYLWIAAIFKKIGLLLPEEINGLYSILHKKSGEEWSLLWLLLTNNSNLIVDLFGQYEKWDIHMLIVLLALFGSNYSQLQHSSNAPVGHLISLYFRLLLFLIDRISTLKFNQIQNPHIEALLHYINSLSVPSQLYSVAKECKLKLIKLMSKDQTPPKTQLLSQEEAGLIGIFSKAIGKMKKKTIASTSSNQTVQKKDEIVYDQVRKRYLIDGVIPEDEEVKSEQNANSTIPKGDDNPCAQNSIDKIDKVKPPPPPPAKRKLQPPPNPVKKNKFQSNRYA